MTVPTAAVDVGTNSTRLLIRSGREEIVRRSIVTGLGRGVSTTGRIGSDGWAATLEVLAGYRRMMSDAGAGRARAVMTASGREATDAAGFLTEASIALGLTVEVISGQEEAALSYAGATAELPGNGWTVVDIGGGSTEIVSAGGGVSYGVGSVKLTDRFFEDRPVAASDLEAARRWVAGLLETQRPAPRGVVGVAGTWTSLAAITRGAATGVHHFALDAPDLAAWVGRLSHLSVAETARLSGLDPARAPVILGGALVAAVALEVLEVSGCLISEHDLLDGVVLGLGSGG